ncbi:hypothetical protein MMC25_005461 [Agyrium rufum]|nr:hypothetical protein [Agyrium rufum]
MASSKISVYSLPDLKNTTDDALPNYLTSLKITQSHFLTNVRLALGFTAVGIAGGLFYYDHKHGWAASRELTFYAVVAYFALNSLLTVWIWGVEKGKVFVGGVGDSLLTISSSVSKHKPEYKLHIRWSNENTRGIYKWEEKDISAPFMRWFTEDGHFVAEPFQRWLAEEIPLVGVKAQESGAGKGSIAVESEPSKGGEGGSVRGGEVGRNTGAGNGSGDADVESPASAAGKRRKGKK